MLGHGGLGDARLLGQRADRLLAVSTQPFEDRPACRVAEGFEERVMGGVEHGDR